MKRIIALFNKKDTRSIQKEEMTNETDAGILIPDAMMVDKAAHSFVQEESLGEKEKMTNRIAADTIKKAEMTNQIAAGTIEKEEMTNLIAACSIMRDEITIQQDEIMSYHYVPP